MRHGLKYNTSVSFGFDGQAWWAHTPGNPEGRRTFFVALWHTIQRATLVLCQGHGQRRRSAKLFQLLPDSGLLEIAI